MILVSQFLVLPASPLMVTAPYSFRTPFTLGDGKPGMKLTPNGNGQSCHFYFTDHGTFTQGWESCLSAIGSAMRERRGLMVTFISVDVRFDTAQASGPATPSEEIYRPHPGEAYAPAVYCGWNRNGTALLNNKEYASNAIRRTHQNYTKLKLRRDIGKVGAKLSNWRSGELQ